MSQLAQLRQKIKAIQTTKKITHAVRLISMSFYNKLDKLNDPLKKYTHVLNNIFINLLQKTQSWRPKLFFPQDVFDTNPLFIITATSKGLCGSLNSNLFRYLDTALFIEKHQNPAFIAVGNKAAEYIKKSSYQNHLICSYGELNSHNFVAIAEDLVDKIVSTQTNYSSIVLFSNDAKSFFVQKPFKQTIVPLSLNLSNDENITPSDDEAISEHCDEDSEMLWEQSPEAILDALANRYLKNCIIQNIFSALRAEHAARFMAMENSTNNAQKYLERLTLQHNKLRQSLITKEISELASGNPQS